MAELAAARRQHEPTSKQCSQGLGEMKEVRSLLTKTINEALGDSLLPLRLTEELVAFPTWSTSHRRLTPEAIAVACDTLLASLGSTSMPLPDLTAELLDHLKDHTERSAGVRSVRLCKVKTAAHRALAITNQSSLGEVAVSLASVRDSIKEAAEQRKFACGPGAALIAGCQAELRQALIEGRLETISHEVDGVRLKATLAASVKPKPRHSVAWLNTTVAELARSYPGSTEHCGAKLVEFLRRELTGRVNAPRPPPAELSWGDADSLRLRFTMSTSPT